MRLTDFIFKKMFRLSLMFAFLLFGNLAQAQTDKERIAEGVRLYKHDFVKQAYDILDNLKGSKSFSGDAEYCLGSIYGRGEAGVTQNYKEAEKWYDRAISDGNGDAYAAYGYMYMNGNGVKKNEEKAIKYYRKAAEKGSASGQLLLAGEYRRGVAVHADSAESLRLVRLAADQNHVYAIVTLASFYEAGLSVPKDIQYAIQLYVKADSVHRAEHYAGKSRAAYVLHEMGYSELTGLPLSQKDKISAAFDFIDHQNYEYAFRLLAEASKEASFTPNAAMWLGYMYDTGNGTPQDFAAAKRWYLVAAEGGNIPAMFNAGLLYYLGHGISVNYPEAFQWFLKAAKANQLDAAYNVGFQYLYGQGVAKNYTEAVYWLNSAATRGYDAAEYQLGLAYSNGWGVTKDEATAQKWYGLAADQGNKYAAALYVRPNVKSPVYHSDQGGQNTAKHETGICSCCSGRGYKIVYMSDTYQKKDQFGTDKGIPTHYVNVSCSCCGGSGYR